MNKKSLFLLCMLICQIPFLKAQVDHGGSPRDFEKKKQNNIPFITLARLDLNQVEQDLIKNQGKKKELIGKVFNVDYSPENSGIWTTAPDGKIWRLGISSFGAKEIGLLFNGFELKNGVQLFVYPTSKDYYIGAFTEKNNKSNKKLPIRGVAGDEIIVELFVPELAEVPNLKIAEIRHNYKKFDAKKGSGACNININCETGEDWQLEKRAVVKYTYTENELTYSCSGALINNVEFDGTPYILSANHCVDNQTEANSAIFFFNYEAVTCEENIGNSSQTISASLFRATGPNAALDFSLLELESRPPLAYEVYYAGWNKATNPAAETVSIHHPDGDIKKISKDADPPTTLQTPPQGWPDDPESHWEVYWDEGVTEGGSSGAPLFDENHLIVGDLSGGTVSCANLSEPDYFTKFDLSWDKYSGKENSLSEWLDPNNSGVIAITGLDPNGNNLIENETITNQYSISNNITNTSTFVNLKYGVLNSVELFDVNGKKLRSWLNIQSQLEIPLSTYRSGTYFLRISTNQKIQTEKILRLNN